MPRVALTGGIACGKSLFCRYLNELGVETIDADSIVHDLLPDPVERRRIAAEVFADPEKRRALEAKIHPIVRARIDDFLARPGLRLAAIPLLFETGWEKNFDLVCCLASTREHQLERMISTRGYSLAEAEGRLAAQLPVEEKAARADYVVRNDATPADLRAAALAFVSWLGC